MQAGGRQERRAGHSFFKLRRSFLMQTPPCIAVPALILALVLIVLSDALSPVNLWYGPVYLLLIGCAAWMLGSRRAIVLGLLIIAANLLTGNTSEFPYGPESAVLNFAIRVISVIGIVLMLGAARNALEKEWTLARTDQLTGALNRQAFFEMVGANAASSCWSVLTYADLDGLKSVNDSLGHKQGDATIVAFARRVRASIRKEDLFARMGGDEFVILMNVRDEKAGILVADRINRNLNVPTSHDDETQLFSSLGVLIMPPGSRSIDAELKAADALMYEAKRMKIGLLAATAQIVDQAIVLSRHIATSMPDTRKAPIRSRKRESDARQEPGGSPVLDQSIVHASVVAAQPDITVRSSAVS